MNAALNPSQLKAVKHNHGPLLIIAGAGTGKTTVITKRMEYLIKEKDIKAQELAALTFTEKAAGEMLERLDIIMPFGYEEPWISTFHGFCDRILRQDGLEIGLSPDYKIISGAKQWLLLKKNIFNLGLNYYLPLSTPNRFIHEIISFFSRLQDEDVSQTEIKEFLTAHKDAQDDAGKELHKKYTELFTALQNYNQLKLQENVLDFGDLINWSLKLFRERPSVLSRYQQQFKYFLVDEFQDTNFAQLQLIKLLAPPKKNPNLTVVGDDDQAIYAFRGSSVHNILDFKKHYPQAKEVVLTTNYRSGQPILDAAYTSVQNNNPDRLEIMLKIDKHLTAARKNEVLKPEIIEVDSLDQESEFVVEKILELLAKNYSYKDFAILARANAHLDPFVSALRRAGLPYQLIGNRGLFDQDEIRDLLFFLRVVADPTDATSLFYYLHTEAFDVEASDLLNLLTTAKQNSLPLWDVVTDKAAHNAKFKVIVDYIAHAQDIDTKISVPQIVRQYINQSNYALPYLKEDNLESQLKLKNVELFLIS